MPTTEPDRGFSTRRLRTERLELRPPSLGDAAEIARLANDWDVVRYTASMPFPYGLDDARSWLDKMRNQSGDRDEMPFSILQRADNRFIGMIGLVFDDDTVCTEIGYWLGRAYWGKGYMTEASQELLRLAFEEMGFTRVRASVVPENTGSANVVRKIGFTPVGRAREPAPARGGEQEVDIYELMREDWGRGRK